MSTFANSPVAPTIPGAKAGPSPLPLPRRSTPSTLSPKSPLSPDRVSDIMSLPKVYARAAGIGMRSPPLSADKKTLDTLRGPVIGSAFPTSDSGASLGKGGIGSGSGKGVSMGPGDMDRKGKGKAVEDLDPFGRSRSLPPAKPSSPAQGEDDTSQQSVRTYAPPKKPLTPRQLGRIAQSFGIAIPSIPPSPTPSEIEGAVGTKGDGSTASPIASSSRVRLDSSPISRAARPSPHLVTVIPPFALLPPTSTDAERKKWRRGRLVPLQPTYGGMLAVIAREFGLPGVTGLAVFLRDQQSAFGGRGIGRAGSVDANAGQMVNTGTIAGVDDSGRAPGGAGEAGPMVTPSTYSALFSQYTCNPSIPRAGTPGGTPRGFRLRHDLASSSQLSLPGTASSGSPFRKARPPEAGPLGDLLDSSRRRRLNSDIGFGSGLASADQSMSLESDTSTSSTSESAPLPTPPYPSSFSSSSDTPVPSAGMAIVATLELELEDDTTPPAWMAEWTRRVDHAKRRGENMPGPTGVRELRLPGKVKDDETLSSTPQFLREKTESIADADPFVGFGAGIPTIHVHAREASTSSIPTTMGMGNGDLLASPINLGLSPDMAALGLGAGAGGGLTKSMLLTDEEREMLQQELAKRGSALVMSDQLDDLEKMMRQLSPRNISMTSPRTMTPRTAAKVAASTLAMPAPPAAGNSSGRRTGGVPFPGSSLNPEATRFATDMAQAQPRIKTVSSSSTNTVSTTSSSIASASTARTGPPVHNLDPKAPHAAWAISHNKSAASVNTLATTASALSSVPSFDATTLTRAPMEAAYDEDEITSPRLRKPSGNRGDVSSGEYYRPQRGGELGMDEEDVYGAGPEAGSVMSPGGTVRSFLGRTRSKSRSKGKSKEPIPAPASSSQQSSGPAPAQTSGARPALNTINPINSGGSRGHTRAESWKPARPQRPPSPDFNDPAWSATLSSPAYAVSPELAEQVQAGSPHTPGPFSPFAGMASAADASLQGTPRTPATPATPSTDSVDAARSTNRISPEVTGTDAPALQGQRQKPRSGSMSLKGLRHMGSRSFGRKDREKERPPALPISAGSGSNGRTSTGNSPAPMAREGAMGLFAGQVSPAQSTFPGLRSVSGGVAGTANSTDTRRSNASGVGEFGRISGDVHAFPTAADPSRAISPGLHTGGSGKENGFSRLFNFGNRKSTDTARSDRDALTNSGAANSNTNGNGERERERERRMPGAKMLAGLGLGHVRGKSSDFASRHGPGSSSSASSSHHPHPGVGIRSISGTVDVSMTSSASMQAHLSALAQQASDNGNGNGVAPSSLPNGAGGLGGLGGLKGSPSYNSFIQAQQGQARGSNDVQRGPGTGVSGWDGLAELHRATTGASSVTVMPASGPGPTPASPASPRSVRRKPVPGHT